MIEVEAFSKLYGDLRAVQSLSFSVQSGEVVGLVGPNGAGKTTTLRSIAGIVRPTEGTIRVAGHDLAREPVAAKRELALIPDEPQLFVTVSDDLVGRGIAAGDLVREAMTAIDGRGGGRPEMAQGKGARRDGLAAALDAVRSRLIRAG